MQPLQRTEMLWEREPFEKKDDDEPPTTQIQQSKTIQKVDSCIKKASRMDFITVSTVP